MSHRSREVWESLVDDLVYARVLVSLQREQLRQRDESLRQRLEELFADMPREERRALCETALERAWLRAAADFDCGPEMGEEALESPEPPDAPESSDLAA